MPGTMHKKSNQKGHGHGFARHKNASGNRLAEYYLVMFHVRWRPEKVEEKKSRSKKGFKLVKLKKNKKNRRM